MADYVPKLGELVREGDQRDAIHIAVVPVKIWGKGLKPGMHVGVRELTGELWATKSGDPIGVLDPFYKQPFEANQKAWMLLYPGSVVGLRHQYRHPVLDAALIRQETIESLSGASKKRLEEIADSVGITYDELMKGMQHYLATGEAIDTDGWKMMNPEPPEDFWTHYEIVTGQVLPEGKKDKDAVFSCSC